MSISANYTERELQNVWTLPDVQQRRLLRPALAKLYEDPEVSEKYLTDWSLVLRESVQLALGRNAPFGARANPRGGHERFLQSCMDADLSTAMLRVSELTTPASKRAKISALLIWSAVATIASTTPEAAKRLKDNRLDIKNSLLKSLNSDMFMHRAQAALCLRQFAGGPWARDLPYEDVAELIAQCLLYASADHQSVLEELKTRDRSWQKELMREMANISDVLTTEEAQTFAPRFYSFSRYDALSAVAGLLYGRDTRTIRRDCRDIVYMERQILDQLLTIVEVDRSPWHPEAESDSLAAQILSYLLQVPHCSIPEPELWDKRVSSTVMDFPPEARGESDVSWVTYEWIAQLETWKIFVEYCPRWRQRILEKWKKLQDETREDIVKKFSQASKYMALRPPDAAEFEEAVKNRGACRGSILRILVNLTHGRFEPDHGGEEVVSTPELLSLLPIAYEASQKVPSETRAARSKPRANGTRGRDALLRLERTNEVFVVPSKANYGRKCLACDVVFSEYILGPVLLFRILRRVNEWKSEDFDSDIASWESLPPGTSEGTDMGQIRQIASAEVLNILIRNIVLKRIPSQKEEGTRRLRSSNGSERMEADYARSAYLAAAELAIAVDHYHRSAGPLKTDWEDFMGLVKKERIACLGNVSEMSSRLGDWSQQYWHARHAIYTVEEWRKSGNMTAATIDGWDPEGMRAKNERRMIAAKKNILARYQ